MVKVIREQTSFLACQAIIGDLRSRLGYQIRRSFAMAEIKRTLDEQGQPSSIYRRTLKGLASKSLNGDFLVFLGSGASIGLPSARELSRKMAEKCELEWHEDVPLSTAAFYYESLFSRDGLNSLLEEEIGNTEVKLSRTIELLVEIIKILEGKGKTTLVVTTNYDRHFERAYRDVFQRDPEVVIYKGGTDPNRKKASLHEGLGEHEDDPEYWHPQSYTCLYKMHGCISEPQGRNLVVTEEDYINFLANALSYDADKKLLHHVKAQLSCSTILFVGYSLSDWNFRVIFKATAEKTRKDTSYAVQYYNPQGKESDSEKTRWALAIRFWGQEKRVEVINVDASVFMEDLLSLVREEAG